MFHIFPLQNIIAMQQNFRKIDITKLVLQIWDIMWSLSTETSSTSNQFTFAELQLQKMIDNDK